MLYCHSAELGVRSQMVRPVQNESLDAALGYLALGWTPIPAAARSKRPLILWRLYQERSPTEAELRDWFRGLYETLLGQAQGPRMGSFFALYGIAGSRKLIADALARADLSRSGSGA